MTRRKTASAATTKASAPEIRLVPEPATPAPPVTAPAPASAKPPRSRAATPRRISAEVVKAETQLLALDRRRAASLAHHERAWAERRATLIGSFPADVLAALRAMSILDASEPVNSNGAVNAESDAAVAPAEPSGAAAPARGAAEPPLPAASAPAAAPEGALVDLVELHEALAQVDSAWAGRGLGQVLATWTEEQRRAALTWATACIEDGPFALQSQRPLHTFIGARPPGEG